MRKSKRLLAFTLAALQILMLLPSTGMSAYAEEPEAVSESVESDEPSGVLPADPVEGTGDSSEVAEDAGATLEPSGVPSVDPVEDTGDSLEVAEDAGATLEPSGVPLVDPAEGTGDLSDPVEGTKPSEPTESTGDPAKPVESTEPSEVLPADPVKDAEAIESEGQAGVLPSDEPDVFYTLKVVDTYADTQVSDVRYEENLPAGQGYSFSALEADGYVVEGDAEYQGELTEDTTLEFVYDREYTVTFYDMIMEEVITKVKVKSGESAEAPEAPVYEGFEFIGWSEEFNSVSSDLTVETLYQASGVSLMSAGTELSNDYASAILYEDEKRLVVTGMFKSGDENIQDSDYPWYGKISGYSVEFTDDVMFISTRAFTNSGIIGDLSLPASIKSIERSAFYGCSGLTGELLLPTSLEIIGRTAFYGCSGFTGDLIIPDTVTSLGEQAFCNCYGFKGSLKLSNSLTQIKQKTFQGCSGFTGDLVIPDTVAFLGEQAFYNCYGFKGFLKLSNSLQSIGYAVFRDCRGLTGDLIIPDTVTSLDGYAFYNCYGFKGTLKLSNSLKKIANYTFYNCSFSGDLIIPDAVTTIEEYAFYYCEFTGTLVISNSVTYIGDYAFNKCSRFTGLTLGSSLKTIGHDAFADCESFGGTLVLPDSVTYIGYRAFQSCSGFTGDLLIPDSVATLGSRAFEYCKGFNGTLTLGKSLKSLEMNTFAYCSGLTGNLVFPSTLTSIGGDAFRGCKGFYGDLEIPDTVTSIGGGAFRDCSGFNGALTLNSSVKSIGSYTFYGCSGLKGDLIIPDTVTSLGEYAFYNCYGFDGILKLSNSLTKLNTHTFMYCSELTGDLVIPDKVTYIDSMVFLGCSSFSDTLVLGSALQTICIDAFEECDNITVIKGGENVSRFSGGVADAYFHASKLTPTLLYTDNTLLLTHNWVRENRVVRFEVAFNANGGTSVASQYVDVNGYAVKPDVPKRSGYKFLGWKTSDDAEEYFDFEATPITKSITLYAQWEEKTTYTVEFESNGGTSVDPQEVEPNGKVTEPADPVKDGFAFEYWYRDADGASVPFDFESTIITEDMTLCALWIENSKFVVTVIDEYYDVDGTTLLSSETRLSEELSKDSSYNYEALSTIGYKVLGQSSCTGTVTEDLTVTFKYAEDVSVLGGTLVLSIPAEMKLAYDPELGDYIKTDSVYASGRCGMKKRLDVQTPQHITFVNNDDDSVVIENAKVTFGSAVSDGSMQEQWSATELREGIGSPVGKSISVAVDKAAIDYLGSYSSLITYNVSLVENLKD